MTFHRRTPHRWRLRTLLRPLSEDRPFCLPVQIPVKTWSVWQMHDWIRSPCLQCLLLKPRQWRIGIKKSLTSRQKRGRAFPKQKRKRCGPTWNALGNVSNNDGNGNENVKKSIGLITKTTTLHVHYTCITWHFLVHFFAVIPRLGREISRWDT